MFKCRICGLKKRNNYCCERDVGICLDCCEDNCEDSQKIWGKDCKEKY